MRALRLQNVNWQKSANRDVHHTEKFSSQELILRRGQPFEIAIAWNRNIAPEEHLDFVVSTGPSSSESAKTKATFPISTGSAGGGWKAQLKNKEGNLLTVIISSPVSAPIGWYTMNIQVTSSSSEGMYTASLGVFVLLFNPWMQGDDVFMSNEAERREFVEEDSGAIFVGSTNRINMVGWNFGQYEEDILKISLAVLDKSLNFRRDAATDVARRNDPKYITRVLSAMINGNDDYGVLLGNWSGNYAGGRDPRNWNGSVEILKTWETSGFRPVQFGQCWVFAGVLNTDEGPHTNDRYDHDLHETALSL
ncbi:Hypothetical predicted protein [Marmota monax]|uniref:Transglutaminase N-terminal domain-containing protein n=1 Tax=Marmota monax TaxID=9995 RepID=A0A5E4BYM5_MARMO|nr:Hypothetical predicted protein [Marmota monax]